MTSLSIKITGIILAGGKSSRMGENKSFLMLEGKRVIERSVDLMQSIFANVILITNTPEEYQNISIPIYKDLFKNKGPLAGIHSGLLNSKTEQNFIISCDVPLMTKQMIEFICNYKTSKPITLCKAEGFVQQLVGKYSRKILPNVEEILNITDTENQISTQKNKKSSVFTLLDEVDAEIINVEELEFYKDDIFYNMNRKEDYQKIVKLFEK